MLYNNFHHFEAAKHRSLLFQRKNGSQTKLQKFFKFTTISLKNTENISPFILLILQFNNIHTILIVFKQWENSLISYYKQQLVLIWSS